MEIKVKHSEDDKIVRYIAYLSLFITCLVYLFQSTGLLDDPFHHGEYFVVAADLLANKSMDFHPITVHGALDYIPAIVSYYIWGSDHYFLPTLFLYKLLGFLSCIFLVRVFTLSSARNKINWFVVFAIVLISPFVVGYRDLFLVLTLYLFTILIYANYSVLIGYVLYVLFGIAITLGVYWSFDRGIAGIMTFGFASILLFRNEPKFLLSIASFVLSFIVLSHLSDLFSVKNYFEDVLFLANMSVLWGYGMEFMPVTLTVISILLNISLIVLLVYDAFIDKRNHKEQVYTIVLCMLSLFMLKIGTYRADLFHVSLTLWVPILMLTQVRRKQTFEFVWSTRTTRILFISIVFSTLFLALYLRAIALFIPAATIVLIMSQRLGVSGVSFLRWGYLALIGFGFVSTLQAGMNAYEDGRYAWFKKLLHVPLNESVATTGVVWAAHRLKEANVKCVFDLANNGTINGLLHMPTCTKYSYPVYASSDDESELIKELVSSDPSALVYSTTYWSYNIDNKSMKIRYPELDRFIQKKYPRIECGSGYCVRYIE